MEEQGLHEGMIRESLRTKWLGRNLHCYDMVSSTNETAMECGRRKEPEGTLVIADAQRQGKGSHGRTWLSEADSNIYSSVLLYPVMSEKEMVGMSLATALAIVRVLQTYVSGRVSIKWPNDILLNGKKVCGILAETQKQKDCTFVVIGFGMNVNQQAMPEELKVKASSLYIEEKRTFDRERLLAAILFQLESIYEDYDREHSLLGYESEINQVLIHKDKEVLLCYGSKKRKVWTLGIEKDGSLIAQAPDKGICHVYAGEISLRGIEGYI